MRLSLFVACAPGLEGLLQGEVRRVLGPRKKCEVVAGGVELTGDVAAVMRLNLELALASSVRVRIGEVKAKRFDAFARKTSRLPFERFIDPEREYEVRATTRHSRLYHTGAIAERVAWAVATRLGRQAPPANPEAGAEQASPSVLHARFVDDVCTLSVDTSGAPLHRRGYRLESARAPLREDLARALVEVSGWSPGAALVDPLCGAGTLVIEAALLARRLAPGRSRRFAFMDSPLFDPALFAEIQAKLAARASPCLPVRLVGTDRDPGAIEAARANAERAGVADDVCFAEASLSDAPSHWPALTRESALVANMPFGQRVSRGQPLGALHQRLGALVAALPERPRVALLVADRKLAYLTGLDLHPAFHTKHGGLSVHAMVGHQTKARAPSVRGQDDGPSSEAAEAGAARAEGQGASGGGGP
ncbi:MAG: class I SAM-dependent RNA methyltransferase [Deltaproteobacteria bacterium]|nr:class I SAM-dependent RNA methyltransferase [Deltaproteobacteria bacterium]